MIANLLIFLSVSPLIFGVDLNYSGLFSLFLIQPGFSTYPVFKPSKLFIFISVSLFLYTLGSILLSSFSFGFSRDIIISTLRSFLFALSLLLLCTRSLGYFKSRFFLNSLLLITSSYSFIATSAWILNPSFRESGLGFKEVGRSFLPGWPQYYPLLVLFVFLLILIQFIFKGRIFNFNLTILSFAFFVDLSSLFITLTRSLLLPLVLLSLLILFVFFFHSTPSLLRLRLNNFLLVILFFLSLILAAIGFFVFDSSLSFGYFEALVDFGRGGGGASVVGNSRILFWTEILSIQNSFTFLLGNLGISSSVVVGYSSHSAYIDFFQRFGFIFSIIFWSTFLSPPFFTWSLITIPPGKIFTPQSLSQFSCLILTLALLLFSIFNNSIISPTVFFGYFFTIQSLVAISSTLYSSEC